MHRKKLWTNEQILDFFAFRKAHVDLAFKIGETDGLLNPLMGCFAIVFVGIGFNYVAAYRLVSFRVNKNLTRSC